MSICILTRVNYSTIEARLNKSTKTRVLFTIPVKQDQAGRKHEVGEVFRLKHSYWFIETRECTKILIQVLMISPVCPDLVYQIFTLLIGQSPPSQSPHWLMQVSDNFQVVSRPGQLIDLFPLLSSFPPLPEETSFLGPPHPSRQGRGEEVLGPKRLYRG